ncbi:MAG: hypothetical protein IJW46_06170 [Clostridia bacterium]|nr:hypothetical protein [Clostridia bacterium]
MDTNALDKAHTLKATRTQSLALSLSLRSFPAPGRSGGIDTTKKRLSEVS